MCVGISLGMFCAQPLAELTPLFPPPIMSKQVYVYHGNSGEQLKMWQKLFHEGSRELFEQF